METAELVTAPTPKETTNSPIERALGNIDTLLKEKGIDYFVIGSIARKAYMNIPISNKNEIDILVPEQEKFKEAKEIFDLIEKQNAGITIDTTLSSVLEKVNGEYNLRHGKLIHKLEPETMQERRIISGNTTFSTLPPETLFHAFILAGSNWREKDWRNAIDFGRWIKKEVQYDHSKMLPFHVFARELWNKSPLRKVQYVWRTFVRNLPEPVQKNVLENLYKSNSVQSARKMFNEIEKTLCG
jgi:hypothetical protein